MGYLNYNYGSGQYSDAPSVKYGSDPSSAWWYQAINPVGAGVGMISAADAHLFGPGGKFGERIPDNRHGFGYDVWSQAGGGAAGPAGYVGQKATDRYFNFGDRKAEYVKGVLSTYGIFDQARAENSIWQQRTEQSLERAGAAQMRGFDAAQARVGQIGAAGYQRAQDFGTQLLGEGRSAMVSSGFSNTSMDFNMRRAVAADTQRRFLEVDEGQARLGMQLDLGRAGAEADTYNRLAGFYEQARETNELSLMDEFRARMGVYNRPTGGGGGGDDSGQWAQALGSVLGSIATIAAAW